MATTLDNKFCINYQEEGCSVKEYGFSPKVEGEFASLHAKFGITKFYVDCVEDTADMKALRIFNQLTKGPEWQVFRDETIYGEDAAVAIRKEIGTGEDFLIAEVLVLEK